jgi:predicted Zn finger-like uncharacterized protein
MAVNVTCPACGSSTPVSDDILGRKVRCRECKEVFVASAAKVKVGASSEAEPSAVASPSRNGSNGVHKEKPVARATPKPAGAGSGKLIALFGGGVALAVMAAVMVWALFLRKDSTDDSAKGGPGINAPVAKINISDTAKPDVAAAPTKSPSDAAGNTQTPATPVKLSPKALMAGFADRPKSVPVMLEKDVLEKSKKAAVMIRVFVDQGAAEGSGWFAEPGIIITNSHVVNMVDPAEKPPHSIRVFLYPGTEDEREVSARLLALDRENDLAVIRVDGKNLPEPLPISPSNELHMGQSLHIMGFPLGSSLASGLTWGAAEGNRAATTLKVRDTTVAGRIAYTNGGVKYIQLEGGADHGNSGGAIIDNAGHVRSVLVAGLPGTYIRFSIPSEYAVYLLQGRILSVVPGQPYKNGSSARLPVIAQVADPMARIKKITLAVWAGDPGSRIRPMSDQRPSPQQGDGPIAETELKYDAHAQVRLGESRPAIGELDLPTRADGKVYWLQPKYERIDGSIRWGEAVAANFAGQPVDRRGANLAVKHKSGSKRWVDVFSKFGQGFVPEGATVRVRPFKLDVSLEEQTREVKSDGADIVMKYKKVNFGDHDDEDFTRETRKEVERAAEGLGINYFLTNRGLIRNPKSNLTEVPDQYRFALERFNRQIIQSLETLGLALPEKEVAAAETWEYSIPFTLQIAQNRTENVAYKLQFTNLGVRNRNGRDEAVITFNGRIVKGDGNSGATAGDTAGAGTVGTIDEYAERQRGVFGFARGAACVDLETGMTNLAFTHSDVVVDFKIKARVRIDAAGNTEEREIGVTYGATGESTLNRRFSEAEKKSSAEADLPEQLIQLNPFVGAPDPNEIASANSGASDANGNTPGATGTSPYEMRKEILEKLKRQGCLIRAYTHETFGDGSGWLAEPGIVVTNAHVVMMLERSARPPHTVEVFFNSGTPDVKKFSAKILCVDHDEDLAVLQLPTTEGLPEPMPIVPSTDLMESQRLFVIGFPHGSFLGTRGGEMGMREGVDPLSVEIKVRNTYVGGRVENKKTDLLKFIQVEGGVIHGNSGGAIVDMNGAVRCICESVAYDPDTNTPSQMGFCVPSEFAQRLLHGYPLEVKPQYPFKDGSLAKQPVEIKFGDPLKRVKNVKLDYWVGKPGKPRRNAKVEPKLRDDDFQRQTVSCTYDSETSKAIGEFVMPETEPGYAYWIQPRYTDGTGNEVWGEAIFYAPDGPPVERREIALNANFKKNSARLVDVTTEAEYRHVYFGYNVAESNHLFVTLAEVVLGPDPIARGNYRVGYRIEDLKFGPPRTVPELFKILFTLLQTGQSLQDIVKAVQSQALFTKDGVMKDNPQIDLSRVRPITMIPLLKQFNDQVLQSVQTMNVRLPNKTVQYGEEWEHPTNLLISAKSKLEPALFKMKMKYLGVRDRGGRLEAVIDIQGTIANDPNAKSVDVRQLKNEDSKDQPKSNPKGKDSPKTKPKDAPQEDPKENIPFFVQTSMQLPPSVAGKKKPLYGDVKGYAYIDVDSGQVAFCKLFLDIDVEVMHKDKQTGAEIPVRAGGTMVLEMSRRSSNK